MPVVDIKAKEGVIDKSNQEGFSREMVVLIADLLKAEVDHVNLSLVIIAAGTNDLLIEIKAFESPDRREHKNQVCSEIRQAVEGELPNLNRFNVNLILHPEETWGFSKGKTSPA